MKSLRRRTLAALAGTAAVGASVLGAVPVMAVTPHPIVLTDDEGEGEDDDDRPSCAQVSSLDQQAAAATATAERAGRVERATRRALAQAQATGTSSQKRAAAARYARVQRTARAARAAATAARQRATIAHARNVTCPNPTPTPTPTPPPPPPPTPGGQPPTSLTAPLDVSAGTASSLNTGAFRVRWTAVTGATGYEVSRNGVLLGTSTTTSYRPATSSLNARDTYTVVATYGTLKSPASAPVSAGRFVGDPGRDGVYGQITVSLAVTGTRVTGCWATYPTSGDSAAINSVAIPTLCSEAIIAQSAAIASVSGASFTSPGFKASLQSALTRAGI